MSVIAQSGTDMLVIAQSGTDYVDLPTLPLFYCRKYFSEWNLFYSFFFFKCELLIISVLQNEPHIIN